MFHRTARLFLRPPFLEDREEVVAGIGDAGLLRRLGKAFWLPRGDSPADFASSARDGSAPHFLVTLPHAAGSAVIGAAALTRQAEGVELGLFIAHPYRGQGYGTEAACALLAIAGMLGHRELVASGMVDDPAARRTLEKVGFVPEKNMAEALAPTFRRFRRINPAGAPCAPFPKAAA